MDDTTKDKLVINLTNSWKMASNWWFTALGTIGVVWVNLPAEQQQALLAHLPVPGWVLPIAATVIGIAARVWPQKSITPEVAAAKSAEASAKPDESAS